MWINTEFGPESEVSDLLVNETFLHIFSEFLEKYILHKSQEYINNLEEDTRKTMWKILNIFYKKSNWEDLDKEELFNFLWKFFTNSIDLYTFLEFLGDYKYFKEGKWKQELNTALEIWDYLLELYWKKDKYADSVIIEETRSKDKVKDIVWTKELSNVALKLMKYWYPITVDDWTPITNVDLEDNIYYKQWKLFIKVFYWNWSEKYINPEWIVLKSKEWLIIRKIEYNFPFWWFQIIKFIDENLDMQIDIFNYSEWTKFTSANIQDVTVSSFKYNKMELDYILLKVNNQYDEIVSVLYNESMEQITLLELVKFLNLGDNVNPLSNLTYSTKDWNIPYNEILLSKIWFRNNVRWIEYIYLEVYVEWEIMKWMITQKWDFLIDKFDLVESVYDLHTIEWFEFLAFWHNKNNLQWYFDINNEVIYVKWVKVQSFEKTHLQVDWEDCYRINGKDWFVISKSILMFELSSYDSFTEEELIGELSNAKV